MLHSLARSNDPPSSAAIPSSAAGKRVLIVDDDEAVRTSLSTVLTARGYLTIEAEDGATALSYLREPAEAIDAVVLDMQMPGMNGREVLVALRMIHPDLPVIMASGIDPAGAGDAADTRLWFIQKSLGPQALLVQLGELLQPAA
jgi:CheY-like chemotaxis protein